MNKLKQHLNERLQTLTLTPAMEASILAEAARPKARFSRRMVAAVLAAACLMSITAAAAVGATGWSWTRDKELVATRTLSTYEDLPEETLDFLEGLIAAKQRKVAFDSFDAFAETMGYSLLRAQGMILTQGLSNGSDEAAPLIDVRVSGLDITTAGINAKYTGDIRDAEGNKTAELTVYPAALDLSEDPSEVPFHYDEATMSRALCAQYEIRTLGVAADLVSWADKTIVDAYFTYEGVAYRMMITAQPDGDPVTQACAILETLYN